MNSVASIPHIDSLVAPIGSHTPRAVTQVVSNSPFTTLRRDSGCPHIGTTYDSFGNTACAQSLHSFTIPPYFASHDENPCA